jgi:hypothetical protein
MTTQTREAKTNVPAVTSGVNALAAIDTSLAEADSRTGYGKLLKFSRGQYLLGADGDVIAKNTVVTAGCDLTLVGFVRWEDGQPVEHKLLPVTSGGPFYRRVDLGFHDKEAWEKNSAGEARDPWQEQILLPMMNADGEINTFVTGSVTGKKSVLRLLREYRNHAKRNPNNYPQIKLGVDHFVHSDKTIGKVFYPSFEVVGHVDRTAFTEALGSLGVTAGEAPQPSNEAAF